MKTWTALGMPCGLVAGALAQEIRTHAPPAEVVSKPAVIYIGTDCGQATTSCP